MASDTLIIHGKEYVVAPALKVDNWQAGGQDTLDYRFKNQRRTGPVNEVVVHETVTCSSASTLRVLEPAGASNPGGRNLGIHFVVDPNGTVYQNGDLADDLLWHATMHNPVSVGIETVNPFDPKLMPKNGPWTQVMNAPWATASGGKYVVPTPESAEAVAQLLMWLTSGTAPELTIPANWIGLGANNKMALGRVPGADKLSPGIYSHMYFDHGDGSWLVLYAWMRMAPGLSPEEAYSEAIKRATGAHADGVDVSDLMSGVITLPEVTIVGDPNAPADP